MAAQPEPRLEPASHAGDAGPAVARAEAVILPLRRLAGDGRPLIDEAAGDRLGAASGLLLGLLIGAGLWVAIGMLAWLTIG